MNIALGALIIILLLSSVITFRYAVTRNNENLKGLLAAQSISDSFWFFIFVPVTINFLFVLSIGFFCEIKYDLLFKLLIGDKDLKINNLLFHKDLLAFLAFTFVSLLVGYLFGLWFNNLDRKRNVIKSLLGLETIEWYSLFDGQALAEDEETEEYDLILVDVLSNTKESTIIYSGVLVEYFFKPKTNELEFLVLTAAKRRDLRKEQHTTGSDPKNSSYSITTGVGVKIPGKYFIIPMKEVLNINISYTKISTSPEDQEAVSVNINKLNS